MFVFVFTALLSVTSVQAWWGTAHMIVARIAEKQLSEEQPEVLAAVLAVLKQSTFANYLHLEDRYPLVESATFADQIKRAGFSDQSHWHFVDTPFFAD